MDRKELIEKNLTLLQSNDKEIKDLIINILFPNDFNLTLNFKCEKILEEYDFYGMNGSTKLSVIDTLTNLELFNSTQNFYNYYKYTRMPEYYLMKDFILFFIQSDKLGGVIFTTKNQTLYNQKGIVFDTDFVIDNIIDSFKIDFNLITEFSFDINFDKEFNIYKISNVKIISHKKLSLMEKIISWIKKIFYEKKRIN